MGKRENHELVVPELIRDREGKSIEHSYPQIGAASPLWCGVGELDEHRESCFDLFFKLTAEPAPA